jgi:hypothetical protein
MPTSSRVPTSGSVITRRALARVACAAIVTLWAAVLPATRADTLPSRLSDDEYWKLIVACSEPGGVFQSDNLVSNERLFQQVLPSLQKMKRGGVYLGVAPDQNFTYILALEPKIAFIVDIRRGNLLAHLMYKALFEISADRGEFLSRLFARPKPKSVPADAPASELFDAFRLAPTSDALQRESLKAIEEQLMRHHGFPLTEEDLAGIAYVHGMFVQFGPDLTYSSSTGRGGRNMPTYAELQSSVDPSGRNRAYVGSEEQFRAMKAFETRNLLVPVVGDFAGPKALRAVGRYLADHGATVSVFYTSNVEQYLFQNGVWRDFYGNVAVLPQDESSVFLRSARGMDVVDPMAGLLKEVAEGHIRSYVDVTMRGVRQP